MLAQERAFTVAQGLECWAAPFPPGLWWALAQVQSLVISLSGSAWDSFPVGPLLPMGMHFLPRLSSQTSPNIVLICSYQELPDPMFPYLKH